MVKKSNLLESKMTLEDFFTLTEMKDGLMVLSRVEELVRVMQKDSNCVVKNFPEAARQWSAVASALAATENKDSLDLFIRLDGIRFLKHWLQEAQKCTEDNIDCSVEESITSLLGALEKLPIDQECSKSSGIEVTVKNLFGHKSSRVVDRAKALYHSWNKGRNNDSDNSNVVRDGTCYDNEVSASAVVAVESGSSEHSAVEISSLRENGNAEKAGEENFSTKTEFSTPPEGTASTEALDCSVSGKGDIEESLDASKPKDSTDDVKRTKFSEGCMLGPMEVSSDAVTSMPVCSSSPSDYPSQGSDKNPDVPSHLDVKVRDSCPKSCPDSDLNMIASESSKMKVKHKATGECGECLPNVLRDLTCEVDSLSKPENPESSFSRAEDTSSVKDVGELSMEVGRGEDSVITDNLSKLKTVTKDSDRMDGRLQSEPKCAVNDDALEVAQRIAGELEEELGNYSEPFCSSSEKRYSKMDQPGSPDSVNGKPVHGTEATQNLSGGASHCEGNNVDTEPEDCIQDTVSSLVTGNAQEVASNSGKGMLGFDLNEEIYPEEMDCPKTPMSAPISILATSGPPAVARPPLVPIQVEGGSAVTSAFHPADLEKTSDVYKTVSAEGSSYSLKQRQDLLEIDLNVADDGVDGAADTIITDQIPASSGIISGESLVEVNSKRAERLNLDLNRVGDDDDAPSSHRREVDSFYHNLDEHRSPSHAASSSSRQPSMINIDLNENLSFTNDMYDQQNDLGQSSSKEMSASVGFKQEDSDVLIIGSRAPVNGRNFTPSQSLLLNGQVGNSSRGTNLARPQGVMEFQHPVACASSPFGYSGFIMGPSMTLSTVSGPGSIPYMIDSRGAPIVPQIMGSAVTFPPSCSPQPFLMGMNSQPFHVNGVKPAKAGFDLNSSLMVEGGNRETGALRPGQSQLMEGSMWSTSQCLNSGIGMKRSEPDGGMEHYPFSYKQQRVWQ